MRRLARASILSAIVLAAIVRPQRADDPIFKLWSDYSTIVEDIGPDGADGSGGTGGRIRGLAATADGAVSYAASEFGGLYRSSDGGQTWARIDSFLPQGAWDVAVDPSNAQKLYATALYDGRADSRAGISVSTDGGQSWTKPPTLTPPDGFCAPFAKEEPSGFGISIDHASPNVVAAGTNCGVAISTDSGATWTYSDPSPEDPAEPIYDVVVHDGGIVDILGVDGHRRSLTLGMTWEPNTSAVSLPSSVGQLAISPHEPHVILALVGSTVFESTDGGQTWLGAKTNPSLTTRPPFLRTSARSPTTFDLWFGHRSLYRETCTTPNSPAPGGAARCPVDAWVGPFQTGAHADAGDLLLDPTVAVGACPRLYGNDGGVYVNTHASAPACHSPEWARPDVSPHGLWAWGFDGWQDGQGGTVLFAGTQDNGLFHTAQAEATHPAWDNVTGAADLFSVATGTNVVVFTTCCSLHLKWAPLGLGYGAQEIDTYPPGKLPAFRFIKAVEHFGQDRFVAVTDAGVFVTDEIWADPVVWTALGSPPDPGRLIGVKASRSGTPTFFVMRRPLGATDLADSLQPFELWRYQGGGPGGVWEMVLPPGGSGGFSVFDVDPSHPDRIIASHLEDGADPQMVMTEDGGDNWAPLSDLDALMTSSGAFPYRNHLGLAINHWLIGYPQPTLVAFDPHQPGVMVAGAVDSGLFITFDQGTSWSRVRNPILGLPGVPTPHVPRPMHAYFEPPTVVSSSKRFNFYVGTVGRGVFKVRTRMPFLFVDICDLHPEICYPIPKDPLFILECAGGGCLGFSPLSDHCQGACALRPEAPYVRVRLDGFDAANWDVHVLDGQGSPVFSQMRATARGAVLGFRGTEDARGGGVGAYQLVFATRTEARLPAQRFRSDVTFSARPLVSATRGPGGVAGVSSGR
jgi:hypothetical protein